MRALRLQPDQHPGPLFEDLPVRRAQALERAASRRGCIEVGREERHVVTIEAERIAAWLTDAGFRTPRVVPLPPDPSASGPLLFLATASA